MPSSRDSSHWREFVRIALEALGRYKLRTSLSVLGVVLGVAAVISMMSVSEGAAREALRQVEALGLDNLVARSQASTTVPGSWRGLVASDADRVMALVPFAQSSSPVVHRYARLSRAERSAMAQVLGVRPSYQGILRLVVERGRFLAATDERAVAHACVLGAALARELFGYRDPLGERVRIGAGYFEVVGVLREQGGPDAKSGSTLAWHDLNRIALVPFPTLTGRTLDISPDQPADEVWLQVSEGERAEELGKVFARTLAGLRGDRQINIVVPRELLAQRYRTQRTFSIVVGSVAVLALVVGGIGIMNIMLTSVVERTREIGVRRTVGATRRDVTLQFLTETLMMTLSGGALGIVIGAGVSWGITAFAGWSTRVSPLAVVLGFVVSFVVGLVFGLYPAMKAAALEPVDAMRYE
jgi:putative ABC transport system permease protein